LAHLDLADDVEQDVVLAVNEAASNAMEHAYACTSAGDIVEIIFWRPTVGASAGTAGRAQRS
jgi:two-component sensor histidine kinase